MYSYKWIEGEKALDEFCEKRFKAKPRFVETIGHCGGATIYEIYKYRDENDTSKGCAQMFLLFMEHFSGKYSFTQIQNIMKQSYGEIRANKHP